MSLFVQLERYVGQYGGEGINHEDQTFTGEFVLSKSINSFSISFKATGAKGELYHEERTTIALSTNEKPGLWSVNTNNPVMLQHDFRREVSEPGVKKIIFGFGDTETLSSFREEITLEMYENGDLGYRYSWGMPGGEFRDRSGLRMVKKP